MHASSSQKPEGTSSRRSGRPSLTRAAPAIGALVAGFLGVVACTDAGGNVSGGTPTFDASVVETSTPVVTGTGSKFSDLYRDYFGPSGVAKCSGNPGACHGDANSPGAQDIGYICPGNDATSGDAGGAGAEAGAAGGEGGTTDDPVKRETCRTTMMKNILVTAAGSGVATCGMPFSKSYMYNVIRKSITPAFGENYMPKTPFTYTFTDADLARIDTWVTGGCNDD